MRAPLRLDMDVQLSDYEVMISPTFSTTHRLGNPDILSISLSDNDIIDQVPVLRSWMHPRCSISGWKLEDGVGYS